MAESLGYNEMFRAYELDISRLRKRVADLERERDEAMVALTGVTRPPLSSEGRQDATTVSDRGTEEAAGGGTQAGEFSPANLQVVWASVNHGPDAVPAGPGVPALSMPILRNSQVTESNTSGAYVRLRAEHAARERAERERDEARVEIERCYRLLMGMSCVYCEQIIGSDKPNQDIAIEELKAHVRTCPKHPLARHCAALRELVEAWPDVVECLRNGTNSARFHTALYKTKEVLGE